MKSSVIPLLLSLALLSGAPSFGQTAPAPVPSLQLDLQSSAIKVSPTLYGLMTEEINHSYDGGLYGELVRNRVFKDDPRKPINWSLAVADGAAATIALDETQPLNTSIPTSLRIDITAASSGRRAGVSNGGFWGIPVKPNTPYRASFYAKAAAGFTGPVVVSIESEDGATVYARGEVSGLTNDWRQHAITLTTGALVPTTKARLTLTAECPGTLWLNLVSLFPPTYKNRPNGNRPDIMQLMADMKPTFLRFPGGNYLQGRTVEDRFPWKKTLGSLETRPGHHCNWGYRSSDGMGLLEFLNWCEDLKVEPVLAVYSGFSLPTSANNNRGTAIKTGPDLQPFVDEALEEIEYVIGGTDTRWGAVRAQDGHPEPFKLTYVEIGNEDHFDGAKTYDARFAQFYDAIKAKYPHLQLISSAPGNVTTRQPDLFDVHHYQHSANLLNAHTRFDKVSRSGPKIFVGEWATREGEPTTNLFGALCDAVFMAGMERNSDIVVMSCYAPLLVNVNPGGMQWKSNLIGYDALNSYGSPSYYAQKMFSTYLGDTVVPIHADAIPLETWQPPTPKDKPKPPTLQIPVLFSSATRDSASGIIYLKVINTAATSQTVHIDLKGATTVAPEGKEVVLTSAQPIDTNTITNPTNIVPVTSEITGMGRSFTRTFVPYSITVLTLRAH